MRVTPLKAKVKEITPEPEDYKKEASREVERKR